ncbi:MAG TPA: TolC family protein [Xanthomonadales bacterium]|nr:TolC family protein [Xanthomonadales bacterium]
MFVRMGLVLALTGMVGGHAPLLSASELTLEQAVAQALAQHPSLQAQAQSVRAAESHAQALALGPQWTVGGELENVLGTGAVSGIHGAETTLRLSRAIELRDKLAARERVGAAEVARQSQGIGRLQVAIAAQAAQRHIAVVGHQQRLAILRTHLFLAEANQKLLTHWVEASRASDAELLQADVALIDARLRVEDAEHELDSARVALAALWGESDPEFDASGALDNLPAVAPLAELQAQLPASVEQLAFVADSAALDAQRELAASAAKGDVTVSVGVRRLETIDDQALLFGVSMPLGSAPRSALGVARVDAELAALTARQQAAQWDARQQLYGLYRELEHARHVVETHQRETLPAAEAAMAASQRGFELGRFGFLVLNQAQQSLIDLRLAVLEAQQRYHTLLVSIERLTAANPGDAR